MKNKIITIMLILMLIIGLSLLLYPTVSNYLNQLNQTWIIAEYTDTVSGINAQKYQQIIDSATEYNEQLKSKNNRWIMSETDRELYEQQLNVTTSGAISYIEIPKIECSLPIYRGSGNVILQNAVGHVEGSSLPVGGLGTHCVLSGHRGLPSAELFSRLDELVKGDLFYIQTLDQMLVYEVDQITVVLPDELEELNIVDDKDYCTLVTCTPYGINSHRLLVRGTRIELPEENSIIDSDSQMNNQKQEEKGPNCVLMISLVAAFATTALIVIFVVFKFRVRRGKYENRN